jgi:hypothetical protein
MDKAMTYEIQTYTQGQWKIQAFFDDKELALLEARRMGETRRYPAIRVVEETWDEKEQMFQSRIVFRESEALRHNETVTKQRADVRREVQDERKKRETEQQRRRYKRQQKKEAWRYSYTMIALKALAIVALGIGALYGLQILNG